MTRDRGDSGAEVTGAEVFGANYKCYMILYYYVAEIPKLIQKEITRKYSIQILKTVDSVLLSLLMRGNGRCDIPHAA